MPTPAGTSTRFRRPPLALLVGALSLLAAPAVQAQLKPNDLMTALQTPTFAQRLATLEARRQRQLDLGLAEDAARTAREIADLRREQEQTCSSIWNLLDQSQRAAATTRKDAKALLQQVREMQKNMRLVVACGQRPGAPPPENPDDLPALSPASEQAMLRNQIESQDQSVRSPLFVEPVLSTATDADLPSPLFAGLIEASADRGTTPAQPGTAPLMKMFTEIGRAGRDFDRATAILEAALASEARSPDAAATVLEYLRIIDQERGDAPAALRRVQQLEGVLERSYGAESPRLCFPLWQSIPLLLEAQRPDDALAAAQRCVRLSAPRGAKSLTYASALNNLGLAYQRTGSLALAIDAYERAWALLEQIPVTPATAPMESTGQTPQLNVRANLGLAYWQQGDLSRAMGHFDAARAEMTKEGQPFATERGTVESLARLEAEVDALVSLEREAAGRGAGPSASLALPLVLERKGMALDQKAETVKRFARDAGVLREYRSLLAYRAQLARGTPIQPDAPASIERQAGEADFQIQSLEYRARQEILMASYTAMALNTKDAAEYGKYATAVAREVEKLSADYEKRRPKDDQRTEAELYMQFQAAAQAKVDPQFKELLAARQAVTRGGREELLGRIQARLTESAVLLEMLQFRPLNIGARTAADRWRPARYGAYLVRHAGPPLFIDFGERAPVDDLIVEFRRSLGQPRGTLAHELGRRLDALLMQPVRAALGSATTIYVSPDGALNLLPFAALVDEQDRYLIEALTFRYVSSGRDLVRPAAPPAAASAPAVIVGDPAFDGTRDPAASATDEPVTRGLAGHRFDSLPGTAAEVRAIGRLLATPVVMTGVNATETALKSVEAPRVLHIATHGFFLADQDLSGAVGPSGVSGLEDPMLRSGLAFAGANIGRSGNDDGVLTAFEAAGLNLAGTQLVVLSACETGVGEVRTGEGVFGLRRAFMVAGAETLVMSLWQVEDAATQQLMAEFYRRLANGEGRTEALRQAALTLLHDPAHRHPFFWASFIAAGEAGPLHR